MKLLIAEDQFNGIFRPNQNPLRQRWHHERSLLKNYIVNYGQTMISKENGKEYKVILDTFISNLLGTNYCTCIQWDSLTNIPGEIIYVTAYDKFTQRG
jgi:hypothetical protein